MRFDSCRRLRAGVSILVLISQLLVIIPAGAGDSRLATFSSGDSEALVTFPAGGGNIVPLNLTLPASALVLNASLSLEGLPNELSGGRTDTTDEDFQSCEGKRNITVSDGSVRLSTAGGRWAQSSDAEFRGGRPQNVEINMGARLARGAKYSVLVEDRAVSPVSASQLWPVGVVDSKGNLFFAWEDLRGGGSLDIYARRFDPSGNPAGPEMVVCDAPNHQTDIAMAVDGSDNVIVLWQDSRSGDNDIYGRKYDPLGNPVANEFVVCNAGGDQRRPAVAIGPQNKVLAAWDDFRNGKNFAVRTILLNSDGTQAGMETAYSSFNADQMAPSVCALPDGYAMVCQNTSNLTGADIEGYKMDALGIAGGRFIVCNASYNQSSVSLGPGPGGGFTAVWEDRRSGNDFDIWGCRFDKTGAAVGSESAICIAAGDQRYPSQSARANGETVVAWEDMRRADSDIYFEYLDSSWAPKGSETLACGELRDQEAPAAAMVPSGEFFVAWSDWRAGMPNIHLKKFGSPRFVYSSGSLISTPIPSMAATYGSLGLCITLPKVPKAPSNTTGFWMDILDGRGDYIVQPDCRPGDPIIVDTREHDSIRLRISMWTADENITPVMEKWSVGTGIEDDLDCPDGATLAGTRTKGGDITLEKTLAPSTLTGDFPIKDGLSQDFQPSVAKFKDGRGDFVAAWQENAAGDPNILARKFSRLGTPLTGEINVCARAGVQQNPSVAVDINGQITVVWSDNRTGRDFDVWGRRFDSQGNPAGTEFLICGTSDDQKTPRVATDPQNNIVVVWTDSTKSYILTYMRKYDPQANPLYPVTQVSWTQWNLVWPALDTDGEGRIYVTWGDFRGGTGGNYDVYAAVFYPDCRPVFSGTDIEVCVKSGDQMSPDISADAKGNFVVVWEDWSNPLDANIYARKYDRNGTALTGELPVSTGTGSQLDPEVEIDSRGNFLVVYMTYFSAYDIYGRYFGSNGSPLGAEFVVCNTRSNEGDPCEQQSPSMAWGSEDEFVVAWEDRRWESPTGMDLWAKSCGFPNYLSSGTYLSQAYDLAHAPLSLDEAGWDGSVPSGTSISTMLRTGPDGSSWNAWEEVAQKKTAIASPAERYVQWQFNLATTVSNITPSLQGLYLRYTTYATNGTFVSRPLDVLFSISGFKVQWNADLDGGALAVEGTSDNGTTWRPCTNGETLQIDTGVNNSILRYRVFLYSNGSGTPILEEANLSYSSTSYPFNLSLDLGGDGNVEWMLQGVFNDTVQVSGLEDALNGLLASSGKSGGDVTIPLAFFSDSAGTIRVSDLQVSYNVPPAILGAVPSSENVSINETEHLKFAVNAQDGDGDELSYVWTVNGRPVAGSDTQYDFRTDYSSMGNYTITISVSDRYFTVNRTWNLTVRNQNRLPVMEVNPAGDLTISETDKVLFWANASDPDGGDINLTWYLDGTVVSYQPSWEYETDYNSSGAHRVAVRAFDGIDPVVHNWTVTVLNKNRPPKIMNTSPEQGTTINVERGKPATFNVQAVDPDGDPLAFSWKVNGILVSGANSPVFTCTKGQKNGANTVTMEVSDGNATASAEWSMRVSVPVITSASSQPPWGLAGAAALAVMVIVAIVILSRRNRRGIPAEQPPPQP
jgi:hypothetical protein